MPPRVSGVLLHPTSLPGPGGIGTLGPAALRFVDALAEAGQSLWQVLPLGPTGYGDSPYQSFSAFAGNPLLISPETLVADGLLERRDLEEVPAASDGPVDFGAAISASRALLERASHRLSAEAAPDLLRGLDEFREAARAWLPDFALFTAIHDAERASWVDWPAPLAVREPAALSEARERYRDEIRRIELEQFLFHRQWRQVRGHAREKGIEILGDLSLFVAHDSADVWTRRELFDLDDTGRPRSLAGAPPDDLSDTGQLWGNPLYRWDRMAERGFDWWVDRVRSAFQLFDRVRLDHFLGLAACWTTPAGEPNARSGSWTPVPGAELLGTLRDSLGDLKIVAEDLGVVSPEVFELRDRFGLPGMKILLFGFGGNRKTNEHAPHNHVPHCVVYTGTHDNETMQGWFREGIARNRSPQDAEAERRHMLMCTGGDGSEIHWDVLRIAMMSVAETVVVPMQDILGLGNEARMNRPGESGGNWTWRMREDEWTPAISRRLAELTGATGRWPE